MDKEGFIKVADFGLSKLVSAKNNKIKMKKNKNSEEYICGTVEYIAPEVIVKKEYGFHTDLWSFAVFMYEMITGYVSL